MVEITRRSFNIGAALAALAASAPSSAFYARRALEAPSAVFEIGLMIGDDVVAKTAAKQIAPLTFTNAESFEWLADRTGTIDFVLLHDGQPLLKQLGMASVISGAKVVVLR